MDGETGFSHTQQHELETSLISTLKADVSAKDIFCEYWPNAKSVLELIVKLPKLPPVVVNVIQGIIKAGDLAHGTICK